MAKIFTGDINVHIIIDKNTTNVNEAVEAISAKLKEIGFIVSFGVELGEL